MADAARAEERKRVGNEMFGKGKLGAAIEAYSEAIMFAPSEPVLYTNRAMCHRKKESWAAVMSDCRKALGLDDGSIKGHYLLGVALDAEGQFVDAASHLFRALELCKDRTVSYKEDIQRAMLQAKRRQWESTSAQAEMEIGTTHRVLTQLVRVHYEAERHRLSQDASGAGTSASAELQREAAMVEAVTQESVEALRQRRGPGRVPDYLCCKITMEVMLDPVTTPDGITYEKSSILEHLQKVGNFDPVTRRTLEPTQLVPNLALKEAIGSYLELNPWAYEGA